MNKHKWQKFKASCLLGHYHNSGTGRWLFNKDGIIAACERIKKIISE